MTKYLRNSHLSDVPGMPDIEKVNFFDMIVTARLARPLWRDLFVTA